MQFPKKFTRIYEDEKPVVIIRGSGDEHGLKVVNYRLTREIGKMGVYKKT